MGNRTQYPRQEITFCDDFNNSRSPSCFKINRVSQVNYLGFILDCNIKLNYHIVSNVKMHLRTDNRIFLNFTVRTKLFPLII